MESEKCEYCGKDADHFSSPNMQGEVLGFCTQHFVEAFKGKTDLIKTYLDSLDNDFSRYGKLDEKQIEFLREVRKQFPYLVEEFPVLFEEAM